MATNLVVNRKHPTTGIHLRVDWIKSISDQIVPLRPHRNGKQGSIILDVYSGHSGFSVDQESLARGVLQAMTFQYMAKSLDQKLWVPVGTRMVGFVHGSIPLDAGRLAEAEARLPLPNTSGLITIYRVKGQKDQKLDVYCDDRALAQLGSRQFFELELPPGDHTFSVNKGNSIRLTVSPGKEHYLWLRWHALTGTWKLDAVTTPEGEDGIWGSRWIRNERRNRQAPNSLGKTQLNWSAVRDDYGSRWLARFLNLASFLSPEGMENENWLAKKAREKSSHRANSRRPGRIDRLVLAFAW